MHFINNRICRRSQRRAFIGCPTFGISRIHIYNCGTLSVHSYSFGIDARSISQPFIFNLHIECIEFPYQVFLHLCCPGPFLISHHRNGFISMTTVTGIKQHQTYFIGSGGPQCKICNFRSILHLRQVVRADRIQLIRCVLFFCRRTTDNRSCSHSNQGKFIQFHGRYFKY